MNRTLEIFLVTIFFWICASSIGSFSFAQTPYTDACRVELQRTEPGSFEHLLAKFKLSDALRVHDLPMSLENAKQAVASAEKLDHADAKKVARMQYAMIRGLLDGRIATDCDLQSPQFRLSRNAAAELRVHHGLAIVEFEIWSFNTNPVLDRILARLDVAANECADPHLVARQKSTDLFARVFLLGETPSDQLIDDLKVLAPRYPFLDGAIVLSLLESRRHGKRKQTVKQMESLEHARRLANRLGHRFLAARCCHFIGFVYRQQKDCNRAAQEMKRCLDEAMNLGCQALIYQSYKKLSTIERARGNADLVEKYQLLANQSPAAEDAPPAVQFADATNLVSALQENGKTTAALVAAKQLDGLKLARKYRSHQLQTRKEVDREISSLRRDQRDSNAAAMTTIAGLRKYLLVSTLCCVVFLLVACLFMVRLRLKSVSNQLNAEKDNVRQSNQERDDLASRLTRMQRMESLGLMAGSVAHDFNNILVGVLGNAEVIQMKQENIDQEFLSQRIDRIIRSAEKAAGLSRQMLAYAGKQHIARKTTDLNELVNQFESVLRSSCKTGQVLSIRLHDSPIVSKIDSTQIEQVLLNLVTNAVEASPVDGHITVRTGFEKIDNAEKDPSLFGNPSVAGKFGFIEVQDEGKGVARADLERIFEPFFSKSAAGRGLGLSVVYGVVKGHDGLIRCQSKIGSGTRFRALFPVSLEQAISVEREPPPFIAAPYCQAVAASQTVLVVDDEESVLDLCEQLLRIKGWNVITALGGEAGLKQAERYANKISCILLDVVMPEMGATEVLREMEHRKINNPVVLMSGFSQTRLDFFAKRPNVVSILEKPFRASYIQSAVQNAAARSFITPKSKSNQAA